MFPNSIRTIFSWSYDYSSHKTIPPGDDDDDRDGATEVQTNFYHSQYYTMITTKSKIKIILIHTISYELNKYMTCCFPSLWSLILLLLLHCSLSNVSSTFPPRRRLYFVAVLLFYTLFWGSDQKSIKNTSNLIHSITLVRANSAYFSKK